LICDFSPFFFILQQCLDPNPNPNFLSDSDPAKIFEFFRIRIHNTARNIHVKKIRQNEMFLIGGAALGESC
jgi:hypothetical protein